MPDIVSSRAFKLLRRTRVLAAVAPVLFLALFAGQATAQRMQAVKLGTWGGQGIAMEVVKTGATIQFDCGDAEITGPIRTNKRGSFDSQGTFTKSGPGPTRIGQSRSIPARFQGKVASKSMTLTVTDAKSGDSLGTYTLKQGVAVRLHRCL